MKRIVNCLVFILAPLFSFSQVKEIEILDDGKSLYIAPIPELLTFKVGLHNDRNGFASFNNDQLIDIRPNASTYLKLGASYRFVTLSYAFATKFLPGNGDEDLKGKSTTSAYSMEFFLPRIFQSIFYTRTRGYYLYNTGDFDPTWIKNTDPYFQFPDLLHIGFGGSTGIRLNENFSFPAIYSFSERQIKSAGTFVTNLKYNYYIIDDRTPLTGTNSSQKSNNLMLSLNPGYFYTFVLFKNFYLTLGAYGELGVVRTKLLTRTPAGDAETKSRDLLYGVEVQGAVGYNGPRFFTGVLVRGYYNQHRQENTTQYIAADRVIYDFTIGYRFNAPGFLVKHFDKREKQQKEKLDQLKSLFKRKN